MSTLYNCTGGLSKSKYYSLLLTTTCGLMIRPGLLPADILLVWVSTSLASPILLLHAHIGQRNFVLHADSTLRPAIGAAPLSQGPTLPCLTRKLSSNSRGLWTKEPSLHNFPLQSRNLRYDTIFENMQNPFQPSVHVYFSFITCRQREQSHN